MSNISYTSMKMKERMSKSTNVLQNIDILQSCLCEKLLTFEINVAKELEILITRNFDVYILVRI